jgi:hypothetical protein
MDKKTQGYVLLWISGFLFGLGIMLIALTALDGPDLKCTWPELDSSTSSSINT